ncbi:hypothetical protein A0257_11715 [Hymenobacter psoromatis]|nr:hypothetical protein A0257_11715 [Hymenobacter psoromatis]
MPLPTDPPIAIEPRLLPYSEAALAEVLENKWVDAATISQRQQFIFLKEYLGPSRDGLNAQTILVESPYVSQSYLTDYANYYAHCFAPYERYCKRVHFFALSFTQDELLAALPNEGHAIWAAYLGYVVVKPLPAPIGATLLRPYTAGNQNQRRYPVRRPYPVNLLGRKLTIETLIFQQQDTNVSACATTALWMAFHKTAFLFQTRLPSPYHITESAGNLFHNNGRNFPNRGLDTYQILNAIESVGLVSEYRNYTVPTTEAVASGEATRQLQQAKAFIYAYLRMGLPVLLFIEFVGGGHLITATGYREPQPDHLYAGSTALLSDGIERMYVHDDGIGPYSRLGFNDGEGHLETSWPLNGDWNQREPAALTAVAVPIVPDVRIQYEQVYEQAAVFNQLLIVLCQGIFPDEQLPLVWDIYLSYSNEYKADQLRSLPGSLAQAQRIASRLLPKYVWVASVRRAGSLLLEMIFDATDLHTGFYCLLTSAYGPLRTVLDTALRQVGFQQLLRSRHEFDARYLPLLLNDLDLPELK